MRIAVFAGTLLVAGACQERGSSSNDGAVAGHGGSGGTGSSGGGGSAQCAGLPTSCQQGSDVCTISSPDPPAAVPPEATSCSAPDGGPVDDACGCQGKICPTGESCLQVAYSPPVGAGGPGGFVNLCYVPCTTATDCGADKVCRPTGSGVFLCQPRQCESDADCVGDACGHCVADVQSVHAGFEVHPAVHRCIYEGACSAGACAGCLDEPAHAYSAGFHSCSGS